MEGKTMYVKQLQLDYQDIDVWCCGVCGRIYQNQDAGEQCCACLHCGQIIEENADLSTEFSTLHDVCLEKMWAETYDTTLAKAKLSDLATDRIYYNDEYRDLEDVLENFKDGDSPFAFLCRQTPLEGIDLEDCLGAVERNYDDEIPWPEKELLDLEAAVNTFNIALSNKVFMWEIDHSKKIDLRNFLTDDSEIS